ncbi:tyrosine-type recombinase/integrase [Brevibacillus nitrificans]|uniref:tyrosine-type recombinase/integrase n=1 Tax=Brevibacillus nitrificans TaxID=651560 RepID=UPI0028572D38|nr:tyrosine-type recombinase/integrase [Brevibacillus nitrificans]MDR7318888.1 integrase [Brevibacillus nitrificans]
MNYVEPIRDRKKLKLMKKLLKKQSRRDHFLFVFGTNTGLRISDILPLKVSDVRGKSHLLIKEKKTDKRKKFRLNEKLQKQILSYTKGMDAEEFLFSSSKRPRPISRVRAYQIINGAARKIGLHEIGTHTLRKTFGYHFYQKTKDVATLQMIFNHSHPSITLRYIGINQDLMDEAVDQFSL